MQCASTDNSQTQREEEGLRGSSFRPDEVAATKRYQVFGLHTRCMKQPLADFYGVCINADDSACLSLYYSYSVLLSTVGLIIFFPPHCSRFMSHQNGALCLLLAQTLNSDFCFTGTSYCVLRTHTHTPTYVHAHTNTHTHTYATAARYF